MNTYNVTGTISGVYVSLTVQAASVAEAIAKAKADEPDLTVTNVTRVSVGST